MRPERALSRPLSRQQDAKNLEGQRVLHADRSQTDDCESLKRQLPGCLHRIVSADPRRRADHGQ